MNDVEGPAELTEHGVPASWHEPIDDIDDEWPSWALTFPDAPDRPPRPLPYERVIREHDGIASTRELIAAGVDETWLRMLRDAGRLVRPRKGWYALRDTAPLHLLAWRIGGPLACVSALEHHDLLAAGDLSPAEGLHVCRETNSSRRLSAIGVRAEAADLRVPQFGHAPVLHWSTTAHRSGTRRAVSIAVALEQARHCRPLLARLARERAAEGVKSARADDP